MPRKRWSPSDAQSGGGGGGGGLLTKLIGTIAGEPALGSEMVESPMGGTFAPKYFVKGGTFWDRIARGGRGQLLANQLNADTLQGLQENALAKELETFRTNELLRRERELDPLQRDREVFSSNLRVDEAGRMIKPKVDLETQLGDIDVAKKLSLFPGSQIDRSGLNLANQENLLAQDRLESYNKTKGLETSKMTTRTDLELAEQEAANNLAKAREDAKSIGLIGEATRERARMTPELLRAEAARKPWVPQTREGLYNVETGESRGGAAKPKGGLNPELKAMLEGGEVPASVPSDNPQLVNPPDMSIPPAPPGRVNIVDSSGKHVGNIPVSQIELAKSRGYTVVTQ